MNQQAQVEERGFALLPEFFSPEFIDGFLDELSRLSVHRSRAGVRHALGLGPVSALAQQRNMIELARGVLGSNAFPFRATLFDKSPASNWLVVWHQDTALPLQV